MDVNDKIDGDALKRLEERLGLRLLHRATRSVTPTEAGAPLIARLRPALGEVDAALQMLEGLGGRPMGTLRLNVPASAARLTLPAILPGFMAAYPDIRVEIDADDHLVDVLALGNDAGIRHDERLEQDMIAVPISPLVQRFATAAPGYLRQTWTTDAPMRSAWARMHRGTLRGRIACNAMEV